MKQLALDLIRKDFDMNLPQKSTPSTHSARLTPRTPRTSRILLAAIFLGFTILATPAWGQVINEDLKLLAGDGAADDQFGWSIAIADGVVAVGARWHGDNGFQSGSAYLIDASTGAQITKLVPIDGAVDDQFGYSIAIADGIVAVGSYLDDDNGANSGAAYLFDASTGAQLFKLLPSDGAQGDHFGLSIAISNGVVAVGAHHDNDMGSNSGSAYLFDASTGAQLLKLLPPDGAADDLFGHSIAIYNNRVVVGARWDDDNGSNSGSAYLFNVSTGALITKFSPTDGAAGDEFGSSIAINNGNVVVGAQWDDDNGANSGSAYLFNTFGAQIAKLLPSDGAAGDFFGGSIAMDKVIAVGSKRDADIGGSTGSAYLFDACTGAQTDKLLPSDGAAGDRFGHSIAIANGVIAVGARIDDDNGTNSGSAYVFTDVGGQLLGSVVHANDQFGYSIAIDNGVIAVGVPYFDYLFVGRSGGVYLFDASTGDQIHELYANDNGAGDRFGWSVDIDSGIVAVGAERNNPGAGTDAGSAYLFNASNGNQMRRITPSDAAAGKRFGHAVAIDSGIVAIAAHFDDDNGNNSGSAYLFDTSTGTELFKLLPSDGAVDDEFGYSIANDNGIIAIGAPNDDDNGSNSGSAYLFHADTGVQLFKLLPSDGDADDQFGWSIAIDNGLVAIGANGDDDNGADSGSAYLFDASTGAQLFKLLPSDGAAGDAFGSSIAIRDNVIVVGAIRDDDNGTDSGSVYCFRACDGVQIVKLPSVYGAAGDEFGYSVGIADGIVAFGARLNDANGSNSGAAYVCSAPESGCSPACPADSDSSGSVDVVDLIALLAKWGLCASPCPEDNDGNGAVDVVDLIALLAAWGVCP